MSAAAELPKSVRRIIWIGAFAFWIAQQILYNPMELALVDSLLVAVLLVGVPMFTLAQLPLIGDVKVERPKAYGGSIATLWLLGTACWLVGTRDGGAVAIGLVGLPVARFVGWSIALTVGGLLVILVFREIAVRAGMEETPVLRELMPQTPKENAVFALLSVAAGVGEEIAYRGYALTVLAPGLGLWGAGALTSLVFGMLHGYQGWLGVVRTALMGAMLAWGFWASGSLWPAIVAHTSIDLLAGIVLGEKLLPPERIPGVVGAPDARTPHEDTES